MRLQAYSAKILNGEDSFVMTCCDKCNQKSNLHADIRVTGSKLLHVEIRLIRWQYAHIHARVTRSKLLQVQTRVVRCLHWDFKIRVAESQLTHVEVKLISEIFFFFLMTLTRFFHKLSSHIDNWKKTRKLL